MDNVSEFKKFLRRSLIYMRNNILATMGVAVLVLLTFLVTGNLTFDTYSERMFWAAMILGIIGGIVVLGARSARKGLGIPSRITKPEHAKLLLENMVPLQQKMDERTDAGIQVWLIGILCFGVSALVQEVGTRLMMGK